MATDLTTTSTADVPRPDRDAFTAARRRRRAVLAGAAAVLVVLVVAVGVVAARREVPGGQIVAEGSAPSFDLPRVGAPDERVSLAQLAGRPVVVNFWASWCVPCRKEMPALQAVADRLAGRVAFVGVNHQDGRVPAAEFQAEVGVRYPSGSDPAGEVAGRYGVLGLPTTVLIDASGNIVGRRLGEVSEEQLVELIARAFGPGIMGPTS